MNLVEGKDYNVRYDTGIMLIMLSGQHELSPLRAFSLCRERRAILSAIIIDRLCIRSTMYPKRVGEIVNNHILNKDSDLLLCQDELIEAGFAEWAKI